MILCEHVSQHTKLQKKLTTETEKMFTEFTADQNSTMAQTKSKHSQEKTESIRNSCGLTVILTCLDQT